MKSHDEEELERKEQEEIDFAIALSIQEDQEDRAKRKAINSLFEDETLVGESTTTSTSSHSLRTSHIFMGDDDSDWQGPDEPCSPIYHLRSMVIHWGVKASMGHYTAYVYNPDLDQWKEYNDDKVSEITKYTAFAGEAENNVYLLFYVHESLKDSKTRQEEYHWKKKNHSNHGSLEHHLGEKKNETITLINANETTDQVARKNMETPDTDNDILKNLW